MKKNIRFMIVVSILFGCICTHPYVHINAEEKKVSDCIEENEDCLQELPSKEINESENQIVGSETVSAGSLFINIVKMIFALLFVLGIIYLLVSLLKKKNSLFRQVHVLENLGGLSLGQNKSIQIIRIGKRIYVVGVGENIELLQEINDHELKEKLLQQEEDRRNVSFPSIFSTLPWPFQKSDSKHDVKNTFHEELSKLVNNRKEMIQEYNKKDDEHV